MLMVWVLSLYLASIACIELWSYGHSLKGPIAYSSIMHKGLAGIVTGLFLYYSGCPTSPCGTCSSWAGSFFFLSHLHCFAFIPDCFVRVLLVKNWDGMRLCLFISRCCRSSAWLRSFFWSSMLLFHFSFFEACAGGWKRTIVALGVVLFGGQLSSCICLLQELYYFVELCLLPDTSYHWLCIRDYI